MVGAFLVTLAAVGVFAAYLSSTAAPTTSYVVATRDFVPGEMITDDSLGLVAIELPASQAEGVFTNGEDVVGQITISPLQSGETVSRSAVRPPAEVAGTSELTFQIETHRALAGNLDSGDRIDIVATAEGTTRFVATDIAVISAFSDDGDTTVTVALPEPEVVLVVANAVDTANVVLARSNVQITAPVGDEVTAGVIEVDPGDGSSEAPDDPSSPPVGAVEATTPGVATTQPAPPLPVVTTPPVVSPPPAVAPPTTAPPASPAAIPAPTPTGAG